MLNLAHKRNIISNELKFLIYKIGKSTKKWHHVLLIRLPKQASWYTDDGQAKKFSSIFQNTNAFTIFSSNPLLEILPKDILTNYFCFKDAQSYLLTLIVIGRGRKKLPNTHTPPTLNSPLMVEYTIVYAHSWVTQM